jgi:hypothetical protein
VYLSRFFVRIFGSAGSNLLLRIRDRRRNHISATSPFPQIDGAAAIAAERKLSVAAFHDFLADGAVELKSAFASHVQGTFQVRAELTTEIQIGHFATGS